MMIFVLIVFAVLMFKLGMLTVIAVMLEMGLKAALFVILVFAMLSLWQWIKNRKNSVHILRKNQWRHL